MTTILIAEDNAMVGLLMEADLSDAGYDVLGPYPRTGPCLQAARDAAAKGGVSLALLDIDLAGGDSGIELAERLQAEHGTPCLFVTGQAYDAATAGGAALGALAKPFTSEALLAATRAALAAARGEPKEESDVVWFDGANGAGATVR